MGADIHITVGRIKQQALPLNNDESTFALVLSPGRSSIVRYGDIELEHLKYRDGVNFTVRSYDLFSFLAGVRGDVKPMVDHEALINATRDFVYWMQKQSGDSDFEYHFGIDDHSWVFYPLAALLAFDYDQIALIDVSQDHGDPVYGPCPEKWTYRDKFPDDFFLGLKVIQSEGWDFVIYSFDN